MFEEHGFESKIIGQGLSKLCQVSQVRVEGTSLPRLVDRGFAGIFLDALASLKTILDIK